MGRGAALWACLAVAAHPELRAQQRTSSIAGTVRDESGAVIPSAGIHIVCLETGASRVLASGPQGTYRSQALELGNYEVSASKPGFRTVLHRGVLLEVDREAVVDLTLAVGGVVESMEVAGEARLVDAAPSAVMGFVDTRSIEELPLNGRDYIRLATLQPGTLVARARAQDINNGLGLQLSIAGARPIQNNFRLDGVSLTSSSGSTPGSVNGLNLGVDSVREFSVLGGAFSARYGRAAGGVINAATRSGGNEFHGGASWFHRNDNLDARNFFDAAGPPEFRRHQYGGSLGGPIVRQRTFFFANAESLRQARGNTAINTTLSDEARLGKLDSGFVAVNPVMARVIDLYPRANGEVFGDTGLFIFTNPETSRQNFATARIDHNLSDLDRLFFRFTFDGSLRQDQTDFALNANEDRSRSQSLALEQTHLFSATLLNTARFGFARNSAARGKTRSLSPGLDSSSLTFQPSSASMGIILVPGLTDFPGGSGALDADLNAFNSFQYSNDLAWVRGRHSIHLGARFERTQFNANSTNRANGEYRFSGIADLLANRPSRFRAQLPGSDTVRGHRQSISAWYVEDSWAPSSRFTLVLGLRHEWATVPGEVNGKVSNLVQLTDPAMRSGEPLFANPSHFNFAPRAGFSWDAGGDGRTVVRGGYGIYHDLLLTQFILLAGVRNPPFFTRGDVQGLSPGDFPKGGYAALSGRANPELRVERLDPRPPQPYVQHWNATVERSFGPRAALQATYLGSRGLRLSSITEDANLVQPVVQPDGRLYFPAAGSRLNPAFGQIRDRLFDAESSYHAFNARFQRRLHGGLQTLFAYSFSKSIDDSSNSFSTTESSNDLSLPLNGSPRFNRGLSSFDVRHHVVASGTWELPAPRHEAARTVLGHWQVSGMCTYASGLPFSARLGYDAAGTGTARPDYQSGQRPDLAAGAPSNPVTGDPMRWIDAAAFTRPASGYLGNLGRNTLIGPDLANVDLSLSRGFRLPGLGDASSFDFRFEFFNAFNRTNFDLPAPPRMEIFNRSGSREDVGRITSAGPSREIQLSLRFRF